MEKTNKFFYGVQCVIAPQIKRRVKTSKFKILDWIYKKVYGYYEESVIESDMIHLPWENKIVFKDRETMDRIKKSIDEV